MIMKTEEHCHHRQCSTESKKKHILAKIRRVRGGRPSLREVGGQQTEPTPGSKIPRGLTVRCNGSVKRLLHVALRYSEPSDSQCRRFGGNTVFWCRGNTGRTIPSLRSANLGGGVDRKSNPDGDKLFREETERKGSATRGSI
jgi:hypothetical protein